MASHMPAGYAEDSLYRYLAYWTRDPSNVSKLDIAAITWATEEERRARQKKYCQVASDYYDLVTPLYEQGWGQQFHCRPLMRGLSIRKSMAAYEKTFSGLARLKKDMRVLDLGCGMGGPARTIASTIGCRIETGLEHLITFIEGDFLTSPSMRHNSVESLCYVPDPAEVYREVKRVLKPPGAPFTFHDFVMTEHSPAPWYYGPAGDIGWEWKIPGWPDFWKVSTLMDTMWYCARSVVQGGRMGIFTPMYVFVCRKPAGGLES
ncbi:S-adenosyl-L-methionine-dependent methyltransferase [Thermothelomyces heterothallicus CBS 202.75]|uniref:S-adenosyl-L-methionine-dependent methyltransferase n=1 Tax=Thermothelomyces heterothallicus CBS 202.75 TaxID=1149848 RepID=UPI00374447C9